MAFGDGQISIDELHGHGGENYVLGAMHALDATALALSRCARAQAQANVLKIIEQLGLEIDLTGILNPEDRRRAIKALRDVDELADVLVS